MPADSRISLRFGINYFLLFAVYGVASPYLQVMVRRLGYNALLVGIFLGMFELVGIAGPIVLARMADRTGRHRPLLIVSALLVLAGLMVLIALPMAVATMLGLSMLALGLKTAVPVLDAFLLQTIESARLQGVRSPDYGILRATGSAGFVLIAMLAQLTPGFETSTPFVMAGAMGVLTLAHLAGLWLLPEHGVPVDATAEKACAPPQESPAPQNTAGTFKVAQYLSGMGGRTAAWPDHVFLLGLAVIALSRLAMAPIGSFFSLYVTEELHVQAIGGLWALSAASEIPFIILSWKFIRRYSPMFAIAIASWAIVARLLIYALFPSPAGAIAGQLLHSLCYGMFQPAAVAFIHLKTPPELRTTGMALFMGAGIGLPSFLGSMLGGALVEHAGYRILFGTFAFFALASIILYRVYKEMLSAVR